jgi:hypothetical protein
MGFMPAQGHSVLCMYQTYSKPGTRKAKLARTNASVLPAPWFPSFGSAHVNREKTAGQQKRNSQSRRYRDRVKSRKPPVPCSASVRRTSTRHGACLGTGAALERGARINPAILLSRRDSPYIQPSDATGVSSTRPSLGALASTPSGTTTAVVGIAGGERAAKVSRRLPLVEVLPEAKPGRGTWQFHQARNSSSAML